ncbi:serine/threonine protein kinase [Streptomyces afghaniensis]|nr:serine/threonine protein kinase [Streptomyces afghaniensis]
MVAFPPCPREALAAAEAACGGRVELKELTNRRGSAVWKASGPAGVVAVKIGYDDGAVVTLREAAALAAMDHSGYGSVSGSYDDGSWLVTPWFSGPSTWKVFTPVREGTGGGHEAVLRGGADLCRTVADLHASGWIHADLQPSHGIHTPEGVRLIDFAWSWQEGHEPVNGFRGGIVHLMAPELAAAVARGDGPVTPTRPSDTYALAGVLWTCASGEWPLDYKAAGVDRQVVGPDGVRDAIATGRVPLTPAVWPEFQDALRPALSTAPDDRPTAGELAELLLKVVV